MVSNFTNGNNIAMCKGKKGKATSACSGTPRGKKTAAAKCKRAVRRFIRRMRRVCKLITVTFQVCFDCLFEKLQAVKLIASKMTRRCCSGVADCFLRACKKVGTFAKRGKQSVRFVTKEELRGFGKRQLVSAFGFSAVTMAVVLNCITAPAAGIRYNFSQASVMVEQAAVNTQLASDLSATAPASTPLKPSVKPAVVRLKLTVGTQEPVYVLSSAYRTVQSLLDREGITVGENDRVIPSPDTQVEENMEIQVIRVTFDVQVRDEVLPCQENTSYVTNIPRGESRVLSEGTDGWHTVTVQKRYENGVLADEQIIAEEITKQPVNREVIRGVGGSIVGSDGKVHYYSHYIDVSATAYGSYNTLTATGKVPQKNFIAVDPRVISLGTAVYVEGESLNAYDGVYYAEDVGGGIIGNRIDIYMGDAYADYDEMIQFGVRSMRVYILEQLD